MLPNEIPPAIPRQKVKYHNGKIGHVLNVGMDGKRVAVMTINPAELDEWATEYCEPVPEEPRPLRIGDKVAYEWHGISGGRSVTYGKITAITNYDKKETLYHVDGIRVESPEKIRRATPSEVAQYFN